MNNTIDTNDFYRILKVDKNATKEQIRKSYKKLVIKYHPDRNKDPGAEEKFRKIQIAYEILSKDTDREKYDALDKMFYGNHLKEMFMYYQELIIDLCEKYDLDERDREEILSLFNPDDYTYELSKNDIHAANYKLSTRVLEYIPIFLCKKISETNPYLATGAQYIYNWIY